MNEWPFVALINEITLRASRSNDGAEKLWECTHFALSWSRFKSLQNWYHKLILTAKRKKV